VVSREAEMIERDASNLQACGNLVDYTKEPHKSALKKASKLLAEMIDQEVLNYARLEADGLTTRQLLKGLLNEQTN
jgi:hypothetical protein